MNLFFDVIIIFACLGGLWSGANWLVEGAVSIARKLGIPELVYRPDRHIHWDICSGIRCYHFICLKWLA